MRGLIVRYRKSDYTKTIFPFDEDREYWYVTEFVDKTIPETLRYSKRQFDLIGEKLGSQFFLTEHLSVLGCA
jgi:hypothetical protein